MSFTIEDMILTAENRYEMKFLAGQNGWANSISWVHLLEDTTIIQNFWGKELAVTTGLGFPQKEDWMNLVRLLNRYHASGLIINVGQYIYDIPEELIAYCNENDLPLLTVPWEVHLSDMIKDFSIRVFLQDNTDEQIVAALIAAIETPDNQKAYRKELLQYFDVDGSFQVLLLTCEGLDSMDTVERKKLSYRIQLYLEDITHNASFFYYNSDFVLIANAVSEEYLYRLVAGAIKRGKRRMPELELCVGIGSKCMDISQLSISYQRAKAAAHMALTHKKQVVKFDDCGLFRLLYMVEDKGILREMETECLAALEEHDRRYNADYVDTLQSYLKHDGSIQAVAAELFTHRNTVLYRIGNIRKILGNELKTPEERLPYQIAFYIRRMHK
ncbi:PucR family transcriptional regulator [Blautia difficilis]|uniref:PucR family transcriptional regulator ligand-binding domain-containing protein n=1 Tax=Blautia difficilis TaxID=2763027 RepID=A0ABR7IM56_9FIRM|nr:PucR family transcriptional regulator [Blautia difficilis]MBC5780858.1 PucR family transcriptional regulator ligand-binding domain-containing protein [Blautia difficilis]